MSDNTTRAQCIHSFHFFSQNFNSTLKNHISHPHCEALKKVSEAGQSSMYRDGSVFLFNLDVLRKQFAGLVIQRGLPFNHFDDEQKTRVFQNTMQPRYNHVSRTTLKRDAMKLWVAAKQAIIDGFRNLNTNVNLTTDVWFAPHGLPGSYICITTHWIEPDFDLLGFWKPKESIFPVLFHMAMDIISVQATSVASESAFSTSGRVLSIRRTRLTPASLEMCMCLKDHLDAQERKQHKSGLENPIDFEEEILDAEVQQNEAIPLSEEEIALDVASSEGTMSGSGSGGEEVDYDMTNYGYDYE
ncbi:zinc finger BED domain-containing protein RICESLEEPER 2-like protein [Tanacetum coccineum]